MTKRIGTIGHVNTFGSRGINALILSSAVMLAAKVNSKSAKPKAERQKTEREIWNAAVDARKAEKKGRKE